jgi:eukaryotic-like serine/threonine-protein kinase
VSALDETVTDVAAAILDGAPVDWSSVEMDAGAAQRPLLDELRLIAALADLHRQLPLAPSASPAAASDCLGTLEQWGPLRVLEPIGRGAFGTVFRAWDTRLDREVALKLLPAGSVAGSGGATSVIQEGRLLARVRHPNVVSIYGAEQIDDRIGMWMEFIRGETLEQALEAGRVFSVAEAEGIGMELCDAVSAVHGAGLLHRDIKAQNVALAEDGRVVLMDFGTGREAAEPPTSDFTGTPLYLAPEIFDGQQASVRSDIYSLGVVLYHLVTRAYPVPSRSVQEIRAKHQRSERVPLRGVRPDLPAAFIDAIERATAREPEARFETAAAMRAALAVAAEIPAQRARRRWKNLAWLGGAAALFSLAIVPARLFRSPAPSPTPHNAWTQITNFGDSVTSPALSPDGRMLAFIRGPYQFYGPGQIYVKRLPDGQPIQLTDDRVSKMSPVFSPDGSRIAYTTIADTFHWDTRIVPVDGKDAPRLLPNASGLSWVDPRRVLFSEIKTGIHMALVTGTESRGDVRDVYVPPHGRAMVHRSALSPDGRWVLAAEMENQLWLPCRLLPFDGRDHGKAIGPAGAPCTAAAWSPDGAWMYVNANTGGSFHIWRQRFPHGAPVQVTVGPTEETGLAVARDGKSLITAVGITASSVWVRDRAGERQISTEGSADLPGAHPTAAMPRGSYFSPGDGKLYYLIRRGGGATFLDGELWVADVASGRSEPVLPGFTVASFDVSDDGTRLVFASADAGGKPRLWLAALDGAFSPRRISSADDDHPLFLPSGEIVFRSSQGGANGVYRMKADGTARTRIVPTPILALNGLSPDGRWLLAYTPMSGDDATLAVIAYPIDGGPAVRVCDQCKVSWSRDARRWYLSVPWEKERTYVIALREGDCMPALPDGGIRSKNDLAALSILEVVEQPRVAPGRDVGTYAFVRTTIQRNLYRIPLP